MGPFLPHPPRGETATIGRPGPRVRPGHADRLLPVYRGVHPDQLVEQARLAEEAGFDALWISDHFHPWNNEQGQSPFVWSMIGAICQVCDLPVTTAVTCPTVRIAPGGRSRRRRPPARVLLGGPVQPRRRHRRGAQRARPRRRVARRRRPPGDARGGRGGDPRAVDGRGRVPPRDGTTPSTRPDLHAARHPAADLHVRLRARRRSTWRRRIGDGFITTQPDAECCGRSGRSGRKPAQAGFKVAWADTEDEGVDAGAPALAERRACPASWPRCCRAASTSSRPASWSRGRRPRVGRLRPDVGRARRGLPAVRRRRVRRDLRREHGAALPRHDRGLRRARCCPQLRELAAERDGAR